MGADGTVPRSAHVEAVELLLDKTMTSERQSAEFGVNAVKGPFKRLNAWIPADDYERKRILLGFARLYN